MNKQQKQIGIAIAIVLAFILFYQPSGLWFIELNSGNTIYSHHGKVPLGPGCQVTEPFTQIPDQIIGDYFKTTKEITHNGKKYKFMTTDVDWSYSLRSEDRCSSASYKVMVYRNDLFIETILAGDMVGPKEYCDEYEDTITKNYDDMDVTFGFRTGTAGTGDCPNNDVMIAHRYILKEVQEEPECLTDNDCSIGYKCVNQVCEVIQEEEPPEEPTNTGLIFGIIGIIGLIGGLTWLFIKFRK